MKLLSIIPVLFLITPLGAEPADGKDPFKDGLREAYLAYEKEDFEATNAKLKELQKILEDKTARKVGDVLPEKIDPWKGEALRREDLSIAGGGFSISRVYVDEMKRVEVKIVKGSPLIKPAIAFLTNKELMKLSNVKTHRISGETAAMDGDYKLHMVLAGNLYLELVAKGESKEKDLVAVARKLDIKALEKAK